MKEGKVFTADNQKMARHVARGFVAGVSVSAIAAFGPVAARTYSELVQTKVQRSAFADGRKNLSTVSTKDLSYRNEKSKERKGQPFNEGGDVPNENDARGRLDQAETKFGLSGAPQEIVDPGLDNIRGLILKGDRDYKEAKAAIVTLDASLDPHYDTLKRKQDKEEVKAAFNGAKGAGPVVAWGAVEAGFLVRRKRRESNEKASVKSEYVPRSHVIVKR